MLITSTHTQPLTPPDTSYHVPCSLHSPLSLVSPVHVRPLTGAWATTTHRFSLLQQSSTAKASQPWEGGSLWAPSPSVLEFEGLSCEFMSAGNSDVPSRYCFLTAHSNLWLFWSFCLLFCTISWTLCECMCVRTCVHVCTCIHMCTYVYSVGGTCVHMYMCMCGCTHVNMYVCMCVSVCAHVCVVTNIHMCI